MTTDEDPNADLVGKTYTGAFGHDWEVMGTTTWSTQYVKVHTVTHKPKIESAVSAKLLRASLS